MKRKLAIISVLSVVILLFASCTVMIGPDYEDLDMSQFESDRSQEGYASWYGKKFHGRKTANGERYDMYGLTAAHRTLPFGSILLVVNLDNGKRVRVRVNDRGPFIKGRIVDLTYTAAKQLGMLEKGVVKVKIYLLKRGY
jgi:rare lipoprotein A